jgi:hypothetical protein
MTMVAPVHFEECADNKWVELMMTLPTDLQFTEQWTSRQKIGSGKFRKQSCTELKQRQAGTSIIRRATKVLTCPTGDEHTYMRWATEWKILERLGGHPNVVALHDVFFAPFACLQSATFILVIDLCDRDLFHWIQLYAVVDVQAVCCGHMHDG